MTELEIITMGRVSVDLYPEQIGVPLAEVKTFAKSLGGSATNVAVAAARLGHRSSVITKVGDDGFGPYVRAALEGFGVDARWVGTDPDLRTPIVFCEVHPPDNFPLLFYREPKAPDMNLAPEDLDLLAGGHVVGAREARGDDSAGRVGVPDGPLGVPPGEQPVAQRPPKASPAPSPLRISTRMGGTSTTPAAVLASTPSGPRFTTARSSPSSSSASEASAGSRVPTATSTSSRLPTATVAYRSASR